MSADLIYYKKNGYLIKKDFISQKLLNKINKIIKEVVSKEKRKKIRKNTKVKFRLIKTIILFTILVHQKIKKY